MNCKQCRKHPPGVDGLCDECRVNNLKGDNDSLRKENFELRATLAERDRQLAEVWKLFGIRNGEYDPGLADGGKPGFTANGTDFYGTAIQCLEATIADSQRQKAETERALAMATDAANKGDEARCKAGAMQDMIDDLKRQKAELEGRVRAVLGEHEDWRLTRVAWLHCLIKELRNNDEAFRLLADDDPQALLECMGEAEALARDGHDLLQSLRQSTQTEEKK